MVEWYDMTEDERISKVYGKYTIKQFWDWWDCGVMEVRIMDFKLIKRLASYLNLFYNMSGVYVKDAKELKDVIYSSKGVMKWFGINPRKRNYNKFGKKVIGDTEHHVDSISYIAIDIDRKEKEGPATNEQLRNCNTCADGILDVMKDNNWSKSYIKLCSGNGVQLFIKLDVPIVLPDCEYSMESKGYLFSEEFEKTKRVLVDGIGKQISNFVRKKYSELGCDIDRTGFRIGQVMALPFTKNFKHGSFTWRGIIDMKDEENEGLSDYIMEQKGKYRIVNPIFAKSRGISAYRIRKGKLLKHSLIKFILENRFPEGYINNTVWFSIKLLIRDSKYDTTSAEFSKFHAKIKSIHKRTFSLNTPLMRFTFDPDIINNYCIKHYMPLVFPYKDKLDKAWNKRGGKTDYRLDISWYAYDTRKYGIKECFPLDKDSDIFEDVRAFKKGLEEKINSNQCNFVIFVNSLVEKYGKDNVKYFFDVGFLEEYINWQ